jgi:hypothetical protein
MIWQNNASYIKPAISKSCLKYEQPGGKDKEAHVMVQLSEVEGYRISLKSSPFGKQGIIYWRNI